MTVVACLKWVHDAAQPDDVRFGSMSAADHSALELALQCGEWTKTAVTAITVGSAQADHILRDALACGVHRAVRIDPSQAIASADVAAAIAVVATGAQWVWCGDYSIDNGSGSVPAFLAVALHAQQALGVIGVSFNNTSLGKRSLVATRRLDGGRREMLDVRAPAVVSVEGATAQLRRAGLTALRAAATAEIEVVGISTQTQPHEYVVQPYRPRARALAGPDGGSALDRVRALTGVGASGSGTASPRATVALEPAEAAARIVAELREWGYCQ